MNSRRSHSLSRGAPALAFALILVSGVLLASAEETSSSPPEDGSSTLSGPGDADAGKNGSLGLRAFIDPVTGELTSNPSPDQVGRLLEASSALFSRSTEGLRPFPLPGGGRGVFLQGRFHSATGLRVTKDGSWEMTCVSPSGSSSDAAHTHAASSAPVTSTSAAKK